jgi:hypothetical protein
MNIVTRVELVGERIQGVVKRAAVKPREIARHGHIRNATDRKADTFCYRHGRAGNDCEITVASRHLPKCTA